MGLCNGRGHDGHRRLGRHGALSTFGAGRQCPSSPRPCGACRSSQVSQDRRRAGIGRPPHLLAGSQAVQAPDRAHHGQPWTLVCTLHVSVKAWTPAVKRAGQNDRTHHTEADVLVPVVRGVPVAVGATEVVWGVVPGTAAKPGWPGFAEGGCECSTAARTGGKLTAAGIASKIAPCCIPRKIRCGPLCGHGKTEAPVAPEECKRVRG